MYRRAVFTKRISPNLMRDSALQGAPFGPGFSQDVLDRADTLEIWCTGVADPGEDFTDFRLFDADGALIAERRVEGY